jgi:hypothetical protein
VIDPNDGMIVGHDSPMERRTGAELSQPSLPGARAQLRGCVGVCPTVEATAFDPARVI